MGKKTFSYESERTYYSQQWPTEAKPYDNLEPYFRCWLQPEEVFGEKKVLDIGAGECTYTRLITDRFGPKEVVACELFTERMMPAVNVNHSPNLRFVTGDCFRLPFQDRTFDVVFGTFILHQLPDLDEIFSEVRRVLSYNGRYVGIEPNPYHPVHLYRYLRGKHSPNQYLFGPQHLALFEKASFEVRVQYFYAKLPLIRNRFMCTCMGIDAEKRQV